MAGASRILTIQMVLNARGVVTSTRTINNEYKKLVNTVTTGGAKMAASSKKNTDKMDKDQRRLQAMMRATVVGLSTSMAAKFIGQGMVTRLIKPALQGFSDMQWRMNEVGFVAKVTGQEFEDLAEYIRKFASSSLFNITQTQDAMYQLASSGLSVQTSMDAMLPLHDLAIFTNQLENTAEVSRLLTGTWLKFGKATSMGNIADIMAAMVKTAKMDPQNLMPFMRALGAMPAIVNTSVAEVAAIGGALRNVDVMPAQAGQWMTQITDRFIKLEEMRAKYKAMVGNKEGRLARYMEGLGLDPSKLPKGLKTLRAGGAIRIGSILESIDASAFHQTGPKKGQFKGIIAGLESYAKGIKKAKGNLEKQIVTQVLFGKQARYVLEIMKKFTNEGFKGMTEASKEGFAALKDYVTYLEGSTGVLHDFAEKQKETTKGLYKLAEAVYDTIHKVFGKGIMGVNSLLVAIRGLGGVISDFQNKFPVLNSAFTSFIAYLGVGLLALGAIGTALFGFMASMTLTMWYTRSAGNEFMTLKASIELFTKHLASALDPMLASFGLSVGRIGLLLKFGLVGGIIFAIAYLSNLGGMADWVGEKIRNARVVLQALSEQLSVGTISEETELSMYRTQTEGWFVILMGLRNFLSSVWTGIKQAAGVFKSITGPSMEMFINMLQRVFDKLLSFVGLFVGTEKAGLNLGRMFSIITIPLGILFNGFIYLLTMGLNVIEVFLELANYLNLGIPLMYGFALALSITVTKLVLIRAAFFAFAIAIKLEALWMKRAIYWTYAYKIAAGILEGVVWASIKLFALMTGKIKLMAIWNGILAAANWVLDASFLPLLLTITAVVAVVLLAIWGLAELWGWITGKDWSIDFSIGDKLIGGLKNQMVGGQVPGMQQSYHMPKGDWLSTMGSPGSLPTSNAQLDSFTPKYGDNKSDLSALRSLSTRGSTSFGDINIYVDEMNTDSDIEEVVKKLEQRLEDLEFESKKDQYHSRRLR